MIDMHAKNVVYTKVFAFLFVFLCFCRSLNTSTTILGRQIVYSFLCWKGKDRVFIMKRYVFIVIDNYPFQQQRSSKNLPLKRTENPWEQG